LTINIVNNCNFDAGPTEKHVSDVGILDKYNYYYYYYYLWKGGRGIFSSLIFLNGKPPLKRAEI
jgi:hypothetical protein